MPDEIEQPLLIPQVPAPVIQAAHVPRVPVAPANRSDGRRPWSRDGEQMTPGLQRETEPYLKEISSMGAQFKALHAREISDGVRAKMERHFDRMNPVPENARAEVLAMNQQAKEQFLANFEQGHAGRLAAKAGARELREAYRNRAGVDQAFENRYAALREQAGRLTPSLLEQALPEGHPLRSKLDPLTGGLRDPSTGLYASMVQLGEGANQRNVLMFGGTGVGGAHKAQIVVDAGQFMGGVPKAYQQAAEIAGCLRDRMPIEVAGHSLGGGLANYAALKNGGIKATCFNAAALGGGCRAQIEANIGQAKNNVLHINVRGDLVGDGIGQVRVPVQKAADMVRGGLIKLDAAGQQAVNAALRPVRNAAELADRGMEAAVNAALRPVRNAAELADRGVQVAANVAQDGVNVARDAMRPAANVAQGAARAAAQQADAVANAAVEAARPVGQAVQGVGRQATRQADAAVQILQGAGDQAQRAAGAAINPMQRAAGAAVEAVRPAAQGLASGVQNIARPAVEAAGQVRRSIRDALREAKEHVTAGINTVRQGAAQIGRAALNSAPARLAVSAKDAAVQCYENLGISRGKMAIPHQYGGCVTLENNGERLGKKNNPLANHLTGAIDKAYQQNNRNRNGVQLQAAPQRGVQAAGHRV